MGGASRLLLDRHAAGEPLTDEEAARVERALALDPAARAHVEAARGATVDEAALARLQRALDERVLVRPPGPPSRWAWGARAAGVVAAAALVFLVVRSPVEPGGDELGGVRTKGGDTFEIFARGAGGVAARRVLPGEALHPGDALRFQVRPREGRHVVIVGLDSAGAAAVYAPIEGEPARVEAGVEHVFEGSLVLDATLGRERFTALFCREAITRAQASEAMGALGRAGEAAFERPLAIVGCDELTVIAPKVVTSPRP